MPKAHADDELYAFDIASQKEILQQQVTDSKWVVEFIALLTIYAGVTTVLGLLIRRMIDQGGNLKLCCGIAVAASLTLLLFRPTTKAVETGAHAVLLKAREVLFIPYGIEHHNVVFHALWRTIINTIQLTAIWGTGLFGSEIIKNVSLPQ